MKGRLIGALWIAGALALFYFAFDGIEFTSFFIFCLMVCLAEIMVISQLQPFRLKPDACNPHGAWIIQASIAFMAAICCMFIAKEQLLLVVAVCSLSDVGAFTCGKLFGKHKAKFSAKISPNKTIEGYVGGIISTVAAIPICFLLDIEITPRIAIYLALGGIVAEAGDLLGSATKRQLDIKDSGDGLRHLPIFKLIEYPVRGHGGYLDRLDSISANIVLFSLLTVPRF